MYMLGRGADDASRRSHGAFYIDVPLPSKDAIAARPAYLAARHLPCALSRDSNSNSSSSSDTASVNGDEQQRQLERSLFPTSGQVITVSQGDIDDEIDELESSTSDAEQRGVRDSAGTRELLHPAIDQNSFYGVHTSAAMARQSSSRSAASTTSRVSSRARQSKPVLHPPRNSPVHTVSLNPDDEVVKILGRHVIAGSNLYRYTVKLDDGRHVQLDDAAMHTYQDIIDAFEEQVENGDKQDNIVYDDSSSDEQLQPVIPKRALGARRKRVMSADDDEMDYEDARASTNRRVTRSKSASAQISQSEDDEDSQSMDSDDFAISGKQKRKGKGKRPMSVEPTRRSSREGARRPVNYTTIQEVEESDSNSNDTGGDNSGSSSESTASQDSAKMHRAKQNGARRQRSMSVVDSADQLSDDGGIDDDTNGDGGDRPERHHRDACANCNAASAKELLPLYTTKKGRKRKTDIGEWDEGTVRDLGAWILCNTCCQAWHYRHIPDAPAANRLRKAVADDIALRHGTLTAAKLHSNINSTFMMAGCSDCIKVNGLRCMFCKHLETLNKNIKVARKGAEASSRTSASKAESQEKPSDEDLRAPVDVDAEMDDGADREEGTSSGTSKIPAMKDLLFRCQSCKRAAHYKCIPNKDIKQWQDRQDWRCEECVALPAPDAVLAWRPVSDEGEIVRTAAELPPPTSPSKRLAPTPAQLPDHTDALYNAEYLVKFQEQSFRSVKWVSHAWLKAAYPQRLRSFLVKGPSIDIAPDTEDLQDGHLEQFGLLPNPDAIQRIPKEWTTPDRILDVEYRSKSGSRTVISAADMKKLSDDPEESIDRICRIYVKWQSLPYESATWEDTLWDADDPAYQTFLASYKRFLVGRHVMVPRLSNAQMVKADAPRPKGSFKALTEQPDFITNGTLMDFQLDGVAWLYYNWWTRRNCILADEMGLGKTVQIISFISLLFKREQCQPFLIVVPNSTLQNWLRELDKWGPDNLRVVPFYGSKKSRNIIEEYELFTGGPVSEQKLRCHVVLTTYETLEKNQNVFKRVQRWEALVVDEAQRLKAGSKGLLWKALRQLRIANTVLLTGTPVNNNLDELFNLLHFIDPDTFHDLDDLHTRYEVLDSALVEEVQELAKPYFLRRTKEAVLDLPPLSEHIVPLSMSPLQKIVYKSVLEQNYEALQAIYDHSKGKGKQRMKRAKITNVLLELRKTLCHPYLVREELEQEVAVTEEQLHRNLVDACSKLVFLKEMLPCLRERGHRVLLFSQFVINLNIVERFLEGEKIKYVRLDGSTSQSDRQVAIDAFNAPGSDISVFILSTRAGGVGINLTSADTVIIYDADFNPFQDLQAIARAHRIGQKRKVMCFKLMTKGSCEEKIVEQGKKKMVLEQLIVDSLEDKRNEEEEAPDHVESLLLFGAKALFEEKPEDAQKSDIKYSREAIEEMIDALQKPDDAEEVEKKAKLRAEASKAFSYARVWDHKAENANETAEVEAQRDFWSQMLAKQSQIQQDEEAARALQTGRGFREKKKTNYFSKPNFAEGSSPQKRQNQSDEFVPDDGDSDFQYNDDIDDSDAEIRRSKLTAAEVAAIERRRQQQVHAAQVVYQPPQVPPPGPAAQLSNGLTRLEIVRSPTPEEMRTKRAIIIQNLLARAALLQSPPIYQLIDQARQARDSLEQVRLLQQVTAMIRASQ